MGESVKLPLWKCDKCGKEAHAVTEVAFDVGDIPTGAGDRDTLFKYSDLCAVCSARFVGVLLNELPEERRITLAGLWGAK